MKSEKRGFTLIELLVVIAIIGLLASIVLASLNTARKKGRDARRIADMKQLQNALELYANDKGGAYPSNSTSGGASGQNVGAAAAVGTLAQELVPAYIAALPSDPLAGSNTYVYRTNTNTNNSATQYCIGAYIEGTAPTPSSTCGVTGASPNVGLIGVTQGVNNINYSVGN